MDSNLIRIVATDPGSNLGVAVIDYDPETKICYVKDFSTVDLTKYIPSVEDRDHHMTVLLRLIALKRFLKSYITAWDPIFAAHETAYVPHRSGKGGASIYSFASLTENILAIRMSFYEVSSMIRLFQINPSSVKYCLLGEKNGDKKLILKALLADKLIDLSAVKSENLDIHSADAIAIGVTCLRQEIDIERFRRPKKSKSKKVTK